MPAPAELFIFPRGQTGVLYFTRRFNVHDEDWTHNWKDVHGSNAERDAWTSISGAGVTMRKGGSTILHHSPFMPSMPMPAKSLEFLPIGVQDLETDAKWVTTMKQHTQAFSDNHNLFGHASARVWGLESAGDGRHVALCFTVHPSDMLEYVTNVQQNTVVVVSDEASEDETPRLSERE